jgi:hypothetical protein
VRTYVYGGFVAAAGVPVTISGWTGDHTTFVLALIRGVDRTAPVGVPFFGSVGSWPAGSAQNIPEKPGATLAIAIARGSYGEIALGSQWDGKVSSPNGGHWGAVGIAWDDGPNALGAWTTVPLTGGGVAFGYLGALQGPPGIAEPVPDITVAHAAPTEPPARDGLLWVVVPA